MLPPLLNSRFSFAQTASRGEVVLRVRVPGHRVFLGGNAVSQGCPGSAAGRSVRPSTPLVAAGERLLLLPVPPGGPPGPRRWWPVLSFAPHLPATARPGQSRRTSTTP